MVYQPAKFTISRFKDRVVLGGVESRNN